MIERFEEPNVVQYDGPNGLVETVQLSIAKRLDLLGSEQAESFSDILKQYDSVEKQRAVEQVGAEFDHELINFVVCSLIPKHDRHLVIQAEVESGVNGILPWEQRLQERISRCALNGTMSGVKVEVERIKKT